MYRRFLDDFSVYPIANVWDDVLATGFTEQRVYVVQTSEKLIERCMLITTDPGDLVLDPTCGSGTTAYVAEQWGRRWITIDTEPRRHRACETAHPHRQVRLLQDRRRLQHGRRGQLQVQVRSPHNLGRIANNVALDPIFAKWEPILDEKCAALNDCAPAGGQYIPAEHARQAGSEAEEEAQARLPHHRS